LYNRIGRAILLNIERAEPAGSAGRVSFARFSLPLRGIAGRARFPPTRV